MATAEVHLVLGATGVAGAGVVRHLARHVGDAAVVALSRGGAVEADVADRVRGVACDLANASAVAATLAAVAPTHVYYCVHALPALQGGARRADVGDDVHPRTMQRALAAAAPLAPLLDALPWVRERYYGAIAARAGLVDNGRNAALFAHVAAGLAGSPVRHLALLTGGRLYGVHLGPRLYPGFPAVLREDSPRHPGPSWYFALEDAVAAAAARGGFAYSIHRPHFILNVAEGAPLSIAQALLVYAALCQHAGKPLVFLGGPRAYQARWEAADAELIGAQMLWAARTPAARDQAFNVSNGAPWLWSQVWPGLAAAFGVEVEVPERPLHLREVLPDADALYQSYCQAHQLPPRPLASVLPLTFLHQAMVITWDVDYSLDKCRRAGFVAERSHLDTLARLRARLVQAGVLAGPRALRAEA